MNSFIRWDRVRERLIMKLGKALFDEPRKADDLFNPIKIERTE